MSKQERTRRRWQRNAMRRRGQRRILIAGNQTFCLHCLNDTDGTMYCNTKCRDAYHNLEKRAKAGLSRQKWTHERITAAQVRKEDKLDHPKTAHACHFYPPAYKCVCGKQGAGPARNYRMVTFQPAAAATD
jgi:hypothetical protein